LVIGNEAKNHREPAGREPILNTQQTFQELMQPHAQVQPLGRVISVRGSQATVGILQPLMEEGEKARVTVGKFISIRTAQSLLIGVTTEVALQTMPIAREHGYHAIAQLDLMGEIKADEQGAARFRRGMRSYPVIGDPAALMTAAELQLVYRAAGRTTIDIGHLHQDGAVGAYVQVDDLLCKHFAVLGSTGVGKSSGVVVILQEVMKTRPELRIFLIDPHNEYGHCFGEKAEVLNPRNLKLPFWLFNFDEVINVLFGGRSGVEPEVEILAEVIPLAKSSYVQQRTIKRDLKNVGFTVDTPVPYRLADLVALIDDRMGKLENRATRMQYHKLITRIETVRNDPRYAFMFENANVGGDTTIDLLRQLFRLPPTDKPITVMQLAGFPAEVLDAVVSVLCRMAFDFGLWSEGVFPLLFVCEEAHRYAPADHDLGFGPTRRAIARIAKEGRKYGVFLGLVTQRAAELDATILSQCSTLFAMRMVNDRDQALLRSAVSDAAANLSEFVPSLSTGEVLAFGEGVALPARLIFRQLPADQLPKSEARGLGEGAFAEASHEFLASVLERWRGASMSSRAALESPAPHEARGPVLEHSPPLQPGPVGVQKAPLPRAPQPPFATAAFPPGKV
jgi:DNA helicase HerA-like ATPase